MPRVHTVKKARKENPVAKVGEPYYWWKFRFGGKLYSKTYPTRSQLTQSDFLQEYYGIQDDMENADIHPDSLEETIAEFTDRIQDLAVGCRESLDNMPEHLHDTSSAGELLTERIEGLEGWIVELESINFDEDPKDFEAWSDGILDAFSDADPGF